MKETCIAGCTSGTEDGVTNKGYVSHLSHLQGNSVSKSFGKGKSLGGKSMGCAALRASVKKDGNDPSILVD